MPKSQGHLFTVGLYPTIPLYAEGILIEPEWSVPRPQGTAPEPTAPPVPPLDPPAIFESSKEFFAVP